jgi:DNA primase
MPRISAAHLHDLRNRISIEKLIERHLHWPCKRREGIFRFLCPLCHEFHTATNPRTNLARCFRCQRNFNPLDFVMVIQNCDFLQAVAYLEPHLPQPTPP